VREILRLHWLLLLGLGLGLWWFLTGDTPVSIVRAFVGRGRRLTSSSDADGDKLTDESLDDLVGQIAKAVGYTPDRDDVLTARVIASENGKASAEEKTAIGWVLRNDAAKHFADNLFACATNGHKYQLGAQVGPGFVARYSTIGSAGNTLQLYREIHEDDLSIAQDIRSGALPDPTGASEKFIHYTGFSRFKDWLAQHPKVQGWIDSGLTPVSLPGCGVLVVFTRTPEGAAHV
jgi:hypothetical protein